jgi:hypothetical protein
MTSQALKAAWRVRVGLWPGETEMLKDRTRAWFYTSADYQADVEATRGETPGPHPEKPPTRFETMRKEAVAYWEACNEPAHQNWAELTFTWM